MQNFATTAEDNKTYQVDYYNLDVIISVSYRVKSQRDTNFRIWATQVLRRHLLENARRNAAGKSYEEKYKLLLKTLDVAASTAFAKELTASEASVILQMLHDYAYALDTLERYDHQTLTIKSRESAPVQKLTYKEGIRLITEWRA